MNGKFDKKTLLNYVNETHFAMLDASLYLDTHPHDTKAMDYFNKYQKLYHDARKDYEKYVGPLNLEGIDTNDGWTWTEGPWPWEGGCR